MAAPAPLVPCLYTTVKNISGVTRAFGFLGIHGKTLAPDAEYTEFGDFSSKLQGRARIRAEKAFERALNGVPAAPGRSALPASLRIKQTPQAIIYDTVGNVPQVLTLTGGAIGQADPCWGTGY